jgi:hypothetical protein
MVVKVDTHNLFNNLFLFHSLPFFASNIHSAASSTDAIGQWTAGYQGKECD